MKKNVGMMVASMALLSTGIARAHVDMAIEGENTRRREKAMDDLFSNDPVVSVAGADFSSIEERVLAHHLGQGEDMHKIDGEGRKVYMDPTLGLPYDESYALKTLNRQGDLYAHAAAEIMKPGPDEPMPDRFSVNPASPHYDRRWAKIRIGVRFDGSDRPGDVEEYCVSEGWIRVQMFMKNGKPKRERGKIVCLKRHGKVEPYRK